VEKKKFGVRLVAGAAAVCLTAVVAAPGPAGAQSAEGVGTTKASHTLISLDLGDLLKLGVLADSAQSTIDSAVEPANAVSRLVPVSLASGLLPGLSSLTASLPTFESRTPGGNPSVNGSAVDLASPGGTAGLPLPAILGGSLIPTSLTTALDGTGARSALDSALANLSLVGLLKVKSVSNKSATAAARPSASGNRALAVDAVSLLNLGDLLQGLGLNLADLPLGIVSNLVSALNLGVPLPGGATDLKSATSALTAAINGLSVLPQDQRAAVVNAVAQASNILSSLPLGSLLGPNGQLTPIPALNLVTGTVQGLLTTLQDTLSSLLGTALDLLGNLTLLKLDGATISANTKAADTLTNSAADVTGTVGAISVLGLTLPGVDLLSIGNTLNAVSAQLGNVLGIIDPSLKDLVHVGVLEKSTSVTTANGYNNALAGIDILNVKITPPALLSNLVTSLTGNSALSSRGTLSAAGAATPAGLPLLGGGALALGNLLNLPATVGALTKGLSLKVGSVQSASQFRVAAAPVSAAVAAPVANTLPRTGGDTRTLGMLGLGMAVLALGVRRWARRPEESID